MDLTDLPPASEPQGNPVFAEALGTDDAFRELAAQIGREVAAPLSSALERVNSFATSGRMDRAGLRALRGEIERARRIGLGAQQISRFASGRIRQSPERLNLTQTLHDALAQRARETASRGIDLRQNLGAAEIIIDASMLSALLQSLFDWSFEHARSHIEFRIDVKTWPVHARLACSFAYIPPDELPPEIAEAPATVLETIPWQLMRRLTRLLGLPMQRQDAGGRASLTLEFPRTVNADAAALSSFDLDDGPGAGPNSQPMVGRHVLVIASRRETRNSVRESLRPMGLMTDYVSSIDEAREFCRSGLPHAIVFEGALAGENFRKLRSEWTREVPTLAFIEIGEQGRELEVIDFGGQRTSRIGRDVLDSALPSALTFELAKGS